ncbi:MAG: hypothetical protein NVS4B3_03880 [Gemmatimonadaceae bacterium]
MRHAKSGFTLVELLIVVVIIGILAAIAIPKFNSTKGKANAAALKSDLRNIATAEEAYFYDYATYANSTAALNILPSQGVIINFMNTSAGGWAAQATHPQSFPLTCALFSGSGGPVGPALVEGSIGCY